MGTRVEPKPLRLATREKWRRWLSAHDDQADEAWLVIRRKGANAAGLAYEDAVEEALCFGWIDGAMRSVDDETYVLRFSPRKPNSLWSQLNRERARALIQAGKMTAAGLDKIEEAKRNGRWSAAYTSKTKPALPQDLKAALDRNPGACENFNRFPNSAQTMYIVWVEQAKRPETRSKRIEQVVERSLHSKRPGS